MSPADASIRLLRVLLVEDNPDDAELVLLELRSSGYEPEYRRVDTGDAMREALAERDWDIVLSDYSMPRFSAPRALQTLEESGLDLPFIVVTGTIGEEKAVSLMKAGAHDFVLKNNLRRMVPVIERELREAHNRRARREAEEERARLVTELREAVRARDEFLSIASHELNTPLTPLKLQAQSLKKLLDRQAFTGPLERMVGKMIELIEREIRRLSHLVNDLLDVSRIRTGRLQLRPEDSDLGRLIRETVESVCQQASAAGCPVEVHAPERMHGRFDPVRIEEVVFNLLTNAIKYGAGRPIHVTVSERDGVARIQVRDSGEGIAPEDQARIFNRFERAASASHYSGLGLGLYITRQILEAHGGSVSLQSRRGQGSTFTAELPLHALTATPAPESARSA